MRITIVTFGSRGDVEPYLALGLRLKAVGHTVRLATHANFEVDARARGLDFCPLEGDPREILRTNDGQTWQKSAGNPLAFNRQFVKFLDPLLEQMVVDCLGACRDADAVIYSTFGWLSAGHVVEHLGVPSVAAYLQPVTPTKDFASLSFPTALPLPGFMNRWTYSVGEEIVWRMIRDSTNRTRHKVLGLPPIKGSPFDEAHKEHKHIVYGISSLVLPKPQDWGDWTDLTGFWFLDAPADWQPSAELLGFLESGPPPVYIGFGSMYNRKPEETTRIVIKALERAGQRGILASGWGGIAKDQVPDTMLMIDSAPHDWLFPRMAAVVHHGGMGTTAAGIRAGVPTVTVPFFADQPFWGKRACDLGVGAKPIPRAKLTAERLAAAIQVTIDDGEIRRRAAELGFKLRAEDGVGRAIEAFRRLLGKAWN